MATPPTVHSLCAECWKKTPPGQQGILPDRLGQIRSRKCCACQAETTDGIFYPGDPRIFRCRGNHPMTENEIEQTVLDFFVKASDVAIQRLANQHGLSAEACRQHTVDAMFRTLLILHQLHGTSPSDEDLTLLPRLAGKRVAVDTEELSPPPEAA